MILTMTKIRAFVLYLALISGVSPFHNIVPGFEHFPYGIVLIFLFGKYNIPSLALVALMSITYFSSIIYYQEFDVAMVKYLIQALNFISPLFFFRGNEALISRVARNVFWLYIIVGVMQMLHLLVPLEDVIRIFISRFYGEPIGGYRGVTMLETEPARAGFQLLMLYILSTAMNKVRQNIMLFVLVCSEIFMVGSATGILLLALYILFKYAQNIFTRPASIGLFSILVVSMLIYAPSNPKVALIIELYQKHSYEGVFTALAATSGGRFLGTVTSIQEIAESPLGHGADPKFFSGEKEENDEYKIEGYISRVSARPLSPILQYIYIFGLLMLLPLWMCIRRCVPIRHFNATSCFLLMVGILYTPPGSEVWLMALMFTLREGKRGEMKCLVFIKPRGMLSPVKKNYSQNRHT